MSSTCAGLDERACKQAHLAAELWFAVCLVILRVCRDRVPALLSKLRLSHGSVRVEGTPRRLAVVVEGLAARQTSEEAKVRATARLGPNDAYSAVHYTLTR